MSGTAHSSDSPHAVNPQPFIKAASDSHAKFGRFNLAIVGATGVGKSSLVNAVFGREHARVGKGLPITEGINYYHDASLGIWDFEGFEVGSERSLQDILRQRLQEISQGPPDQQISVVWYCVSSTADRLTRHEIDTIAELDRAGLPVILVLTKVQWVKNPLTGKLRPPEDVEEFRRWLEYPLDNEGHPITLPVSSIVLCSTQGKQGKGTGHGLGDLVAETLSLSPEPEKDAFRIAQRLNLSWKRSMARRVVAVASAGAGATAAVPIPVADATALAPIQMTMMGRIAVIYDLELETMLSASALAQIGAQITGQALARSFIKIIPGIGNAINASVAGTLTAATGEAWIRLCEQVQTGKITPHQIQHVWGEFVPSLRDVLLSLSMRGRRRK